uniref:ZAD domain-containing protein n=1 Tax=Ornithorhynchus anatinus TaxID=9258 RepID=A0A6I8NN49_ORNAN
RSKVPRRSVGKGSRTSVQPLPYYSGVRSRCGSCGGTASGLAGLGVAARDNPLTPGGPLGSTGPGRNRHVLRPGRSWPKEIIPRHLVHLLPLRLLPPALPSLSSSRAGTGRPFSTGYCRLCHGKFSSRNLRHAFGKVPAPGESSESQRRVERVFFLDFQRLLGVPLRQDPALPQFVCKTCHAQFYKCRSVLKTFIQRVNASPGGLRKPRGKGSSDDQLDSGPREGGRLADLISSSPKCLHGLVGWAHGHAANCGAVPSLQSVLSSEYRGIIRAVWGCGQGHDYVMNADSDCSSLLLDSALAVKWERERGAARRLADNGEAGPPGPAPPDPADTGSGAPAGPEDRTPPARDAAQLPSDGSRAGPEPNPPPRAGPPPSGTPGKTPVCSEAPRDVAWKVLLRRARAFSVPPFLPPRPLPEASRGRGCRPLRPGG